MRKLVLLTLLTLAAGTAVGKTLKAPEPVAPPAPVEAPSPVDPLGLIPSPGAARPFTPPTAQTTTLSNGLSVWVVPQPSLPLVTVRLETPGGAALDPVGREGLASVAARMLKQGAGELDGEAFAQEVERLGIQLYVDATRHGSSITFSCHRDKLDAGLELVARMILEPAFKNQDLKRERELAIAEVNLDLEDPVTVAVRLGQFLFFGPANPWGRPTAGTPEGLGHIKRKDIINHHARVWNPSIAKLTVTGAVTADEVKPLLEPRLGTPWASTAAPTLPTLVPLAHQDEPIYVVDRPGSSQTAFFLLFPGPAYGAAEEPAARIGTIVLGGTFTSRLNALLREKRGYTYGVRATVSTWPGAGALTVSTRIRTDATAPALTDLMGELTRIREGITPEEQLKATLAARQDVVEALASREATAMTFTTPHLLGKPPTAIQDQLKAIDAVTLDQVKAAMQSYDPSKAVIVLVGDRAAIEAPLQAAGFNKLQFMDAL